MPDHPHATLDAGLAALGLEPSLSPPLRRYLDLLARWNRTYNLTRFLREAVRQLGLSNARVAESRAEAVDMPAAFDAITARAMATLGDILAVGAHLLAPGGRLLAMKGVRPDAEIAELPAGWVVEAIHPLAVPGLAAERHLVVVGRAPPDGA